MRRGRGRVPRLQRGRRVLRGRRHVLDGVRIELGELVGGIFVKRFFERLFKRLLEWVLGRERLRRRRVLSVLLSNRVLPRWHVPLRYPRHGMRNRRKRLHGLHCEPADVPE